MVSKVVSKAIIITFDGIDSSSHGTAKRSLMVAEALTELGFQVKILSLDSIDNIPKPIFLSPNIELIRLPSSQIPLFLGTKAIRLIRSLGKSSDIIIVESAMLLVPTKLAKLEKPIIWDTLELETLHYRRLPLTISNLVKRFIWKFLEQWAIKQAAVIVAIGETEANWWMKIFPESKKKLMIADHSVGFSLNQLSHQTLHDDNVDSRPTVLFLGNLLAKHNKTAANWIIEELAPKINKQVRLVIAGAGSELLPLDKNVEVLGYVTDIDSLIASVELCIAPLLTGAGVKTKILHYVFLQKRVIATPMALEGIEDAPGILSCPLDSFATAITDLLRKPENQQDQALRRQQQYQWYEQHCGKDHIVSQWRNIILRSKLSLL